LNGSVILFTTKLNQKTLKARHCGSQLASLSLSSCFV